MPGVSTEAVWGLSCDPANEAAVLRLLAMKERPVEKGLILVGADMAQFDWLLGDLDGASRSKLELSWPGATTWLVPHQGRVPDWICGEFDTVAVRVSAHPTVQALCRAFGGPLVSTSANIGGAQPAREQFQFYLCTYLYGKGDTLSLRPEYLLCSSSPSHPKSKLQLHYNNISNTCTPIWLPVHLLMRCFRPKDFLCSVF